MKKIKKYFVNPENSAVLAMSVVDEPAVESDFVYLSKQQKIERFVALESNEKHMIYGCALRPDFPIYRNDGTEEYYLEFSKEAVERLSRNFMVNGFQQNFTAGHMSEVEGITITESWIKADMEKDKSVALGLDSNLPLGTWFIGAYCNNVEVWDKVRNGDYHGFSVEALVDVNELQFEEQTPEPAPVAEPVAEPAPVQDAGDAKSILGKIMDLIGGKRIEDVLAPEPAPEPVVEEPVEPVAEPEPVVEEPVVESEPEPVAQEPAPTVNPLEEVVNNLKAEIEALKQMNSGLVEQVNSLKTQPSAKPINTNAGNAKTDATGVENANYQAWRDQMRKLL